METCEQTQTFSNVDSSHHVICHTENISTVGENKSTIDVDFQHENCDFSISSSSQCTKLETDMDLKQEILPDTNASVFDKDTKTASDKTSGEDSSSKAVSSNSCNSFIPPEITNKSDTKQQSSSDLCVRSEPSETDRSSVISQQQRSELRVEDQSADERRGCQVFSPSKPEKRTPRPASHRLRRDFYSRPVSQSLNKRHTIEETSAGVSSARLQPRVVLERLTRDQIKSSAKPCTGGSSGTEGDADLSRERLMSMLRQSQETVAYLMRKLKQAERKSELEVFGVLIGKKIEGISNKRRREGLKMHIHALVCETLLEDMVDRSIN